MKQGHKSAPDVQKPLGHGETGMEALTRHSIPMFQPCGLISIKQKQGDVHIRHSDMLLNIHDHCCGFLKYSDFIKMNLQLFCGLVMLSVLPQIRHKAKTGLNPLSLEKHESENSG